LENQKEKLKCDPGNHGTKVKGKETKKTIEKGKKGEKQVGSGGLPLKEKKAKQIGWGDKGAKLKRRP